MTRAKRNPGAGGRTGARKSTWVRDHDKFNADARITSPTSDEIYEHAVIDAATALGYTVSVPCEVCGHPLTNPKSVGTHIGPKCAVKGGRDD
ncbi:DUF6011 domain-containing protein [Gordonia sp. ABSL49_1]|uniref:DUF6011 domain-containing protein n=1 Tax=Gordonia sp. ABSL49_1 TaxID=2920941 RepID=UPI0035B2FD25